MPEKDVSHRVQRHIARQGGRRTVTHEQIDAPPANTLAKPLTEPASVITAAKKES